MDRWPVCAGRHQAPQWAEASIWQGKQVSGWGSPLQQDDVVGVQLGTNPVSPIAVGIGVTVKSGDLILKWHQPDCFCPSTGFVGFMERSDNTGSWFRGTLMSYQSLYGGQFYGEESSFMLSGGMTQFTRQVGQWEWIVCQFMVDTVAIRSLMVHLLPQTHGTTLANGL